MPVFVAYNLSKKKSIFVDGTLEDAREVFSHGTQVFLRHKNWSSVEWGGVAVPRFIPDENLTIQPQLAMYLSLYQEQNSIQPFDAKANQTFERACRVVFNETINVRYIPSRLGSWSLPPETAQEALLDSTTKVRIHNWQLQRPSVSRLGTLVPGADENLVEYNTTESGTFWLAKWVYKGQQFFTTIAEPYFEDVTHLFENETREPLCQKSIGLELDTFGNSREVVYRTAETDDSDLELGIENFQDDQEEPAEDEYDLSEFTHDTIELNLYSEEEKAFLPLGYMIPRSVEWHHMMGAISSHFIQVKNLLKVRDFTIRDFYILLGLFPIKKQYVPGAQKLLAYIKHRLHHDLHQSMSKLTI